MADEILMTSTLDHAGFDHAGSEGLFSCVVDENPRFHLEALRWYASLTGVVGVHARDLVVNVVGTGSSDVLDYLRAAGVAVRRVDPFDPRSPHCNKISGALRLAQDPVSGMAVLCDTDIAVLDDPRRIDLPGGAVGAKVVDAPVPSLGVLLEVFRASGVRPPPSVPLPWGSDEQTVSGNSNGGLYLVPGPLLCRVTSAWAQWARWLLERLELLEQWAVYVDQVAMAVALAAEEIETDALDVRWNTPTHDPTRFPSDPPTPSIIHYHQEVDRHGLIKMTGLASIDTQVRKVNEAVRDEWDRLRPQVSYTRWLANTPRTDGLDQIVTTLVEALHPKSILDVGAGSGIDWGDQASHVTRLDGTPDLSGRPGDREVSADLVVCLDGLREDASPASSQDLIRQLWRSTGRALVVNGGADPEQHPDGSLLHVLSAIAPDAELYPLLAGGGACAVVALRPSPTKHPRDFGADTLAALIARHPDPLALLVLRLHAEGTTTFYPDHAPRLWAYPVVARLIAEALPPGSRLVDVGAGVTPLAPYLASQGYAVETVDPSAVVRRWPPQPDWNEREFLDYGAAGLARRSWNCTLDEVPAEPPFDGAYSVSVIEQVPAAIRRGLLSDIADRVTPGGLVVLTIDLVRGTDDLWNLNLGVVVEPLSDHGTLDDVVNECYEVGLELTEKDAVREWGDTRVDIGLLVLRKRSGNGSPHGSPPRATRRSMGRKVWRRRGRA